MATPATGALVGTPASISASEVPHTLAIELEPFDSRISDTTRITYGNALMSGITALTPRRARLPWPISRRFGDPSMPVSPTENGGEVLCSMNGSPRLPREAVKELRIAGGTERVHHERLRLPAREQRRAVGARQHPDLNPDRA